MAARIAVAVVAIAVLAWLAVMERNAHRLDRGVDIATGIVISGRMDPEAMRRAEQDFLGARTLSPDTRPDVERAILYRYNERVRESRELIEDVLRREPENLTAWGVFFDVTNGRDEQAARRALEARARLDPVRARPD
jgi:hypothetical protein